MASHQRVLMVGEEAVILYAAAERGLSRGASVSWAAPDFDRQLLQAVGGEQKLDPLVVLFNDADQTYRKEENTPAAGHLARLEAVFSKYPSRAALEIFAGPEDKGRAGTDREEGLSSYLFVGLPGDGHAGRLNGALKGAGVPVAGFGLLPVESVSLVEALAGKIFGAERKSRWALLVGQHETGGLRHVVAKEGNLALTRLTPTPDAGKSGSADWAAEVLRELEATMTYLRRFGFVDADGMDLIMLCDESEKKLFDAKAVPGAALRSVTLSEALSLLGCGVSGQHGDHFADALYAAWVECTGPLKLAVPFAA